MMLSCKRRIRIVLLVIRAAVFIFQDKKLNYIEKLKKKYSVLAGFLVEIMFDN